MTKPKPKQKSRRDRETQKKSSPNLERLEPQQKPKRFNPTTHKEYNPKKANQLKETQPNNPKRPNPQKINHM